MKTRGAAPSSRNRDKAAGSAKKSSDSPMGRFKSLTKSVLTVSNKAVIEAEAKEKFENMKRRAKSKSKRKPASS
jgi:hypothetical protein